MSYRPNLPFALGTSSSPGILQVDGTTITAAAGVASVPGVSVTSLGTATTMALSDVYTVNQGGVDKQATGTQFAGFVRKTPAGSRTAALPIVLTATDNDKTIVLTGTSGAVGVDGTVSDGFRCHLVNTASGAATYSGITGEGGTALPANTMATVTMAGSTVYASAPTAASIPAASGQLLGGSGTAGAAAAVTVGSGLSLVSGTLTATGGSASIPASDISHLLGASGTAGTANAVTVGNGLTLSSGTLSATGGQLLYTRPALSSLTWLNQGTSTATDVSGGPIVGSFPLATSNALRGLYTTQAAPYTFTLTLDVAMLMTNYYIAGLLLLNSSSSTASLFCLQGNNAANQCPLLVEVVHWSSLTSSSSPWSRAAPMVGRKARFRVTNDGTNVAYLVSPDGYGWLQLYQEAVSAANSPNSVGLGVNAFDSGGTNGINVVACIRGWELLSTASPQAASALAGI